MLHQQVLPRGTTQPMAVGAPVRWPAAGLSETDQGPGYAGHPNSPESAWNAKMHAGNISRSVPRPGRQTAEVHGAPDGDCSSGEEAEDDINLTQVATLLLRGVSGGEGRSERGPLKSHRLQHDGLGSRLSSQRTSFTRTSEGASLCEGAQPPRSQG